MKRIVICADGTWNRPEKLNETDHYPSNVLKFARGVLPKSADDHKQIVFYDWGVGSYHDNVAGGAFGKGLEKNVMDAYRFLVHNYDLGDEIFLFGFSRGAYTVRSLCGLMNNCHILKASEASRIEEAFELYKNPDHKANDAFSKDWKNKYSIANSGTIHFVGVWDTVGALGLPFTIFGLVENKHLFYDRKLGSNIKAARHALALDEVRKDFKPTIWEPRPNVDLKQVWFAGVHSDVGGGYAPDKRRNTYASDIPMMWLLKEAQKAGLEFDDFLSENEQNPLSAINKSFEGLFKVLGRHRRKIPKANEIPTKVHISVKQRYEQSGYTNQAIQRYLKDNGTWPEIEQ